MTTLKEQLFVLVQSGEGLDNKHRFTHSSRDPLQIIMLLGDPSPGVTPVKEILVRDVNALPFTGRTHWSYTGLHPNESFHVVYVAPMSIGEPHAHVPQWEEIWTAPDNSFLMLGSEVREMPVNTAFLAPPNGKTVHSVVNLTKDKLMAWLSSEDSTFKLPDYGRDPLVSGKPLE